MDLSSLRPPKGQQKAQRRVGRGMGSGRGKTSGRGHKGARSIAGYSMMRGFEGGQMPLHRRLPKRGFSNEPFKLHHSIINVGVLDKMDGDTFDVEALVKSGVVKKLEDGLKVLGSGEVTRPIKVRAHLFSESAKRKIEAAGGVAETIGAASGPPESQA